MSAENPFENKIYDLSTELIYSTISEEEWKILQIEATEEMIKTNILREEKKWKQNQI